MADQGRRQDRPQNRSGGGQGRASSGRPSQGRPSSGRPSPEGRGSSGGRGSSQGRGREDRRSDDRRSDGRGAGRSERNGAGRDRRGSGEGQGRSFSRPRRDDSAPRGQQQRSESQATYDGPELDESITGRELDRSVLQQLKGLPEKLASRVARHLVAAGLAMESDPKLAYQHTLAARGRAARIAIVREACGEAAYAAGEFAEALSELRAAKRMNGSNDFLPVMADCERALGRPERALTLARNPALASLSQDLQAEMTIVEAGARRDMGETDAALRTLENAPLRSRSRASWVVRLRYAYADTLLAAGRTEDAVIWFHRTAGIDGEGITDAAERLEELDPGTERG